MLIGHRLRVIREQKQLSQGDIEKRTGLLRCYVSRVEHGHTVPSVENLEKWARAFEIPMYELFYEGREPAVAPNISLLPSQEENGWGAKGRQSFELRKLRKFLARMTGNERALFLSIAHKMVSSKRGLRADRRSVAKAHRRQCLNPAE